MAVMHRVGGRNEKRTLGDEPCQLVEARQRRRVVADQEGVTADHIDPVTGGAGGQRQHLDEGIERKLLGSEAVFVVHAP
jgi:hypothetical protein